MSLHAVWQINVGLMTVVVADASSYTEEAYRQALLAAAEVATMSTADQVARAWESHNHAAGLGD
jgi:hypothetical protein